MGAYEQEMMRVTLVEGVQALGVGSAQVVLQSVGGGEVSVLATGVIASFRVETDSANVDTVRSELESYVNTQKTYGNALKKLGGSFASVGAWKKAEA